MILRHITRILFSTFFPNWQGCLGERQGFRILPLYHIESLPMSSFQTILLSLIISNPIAFPLVKNSFVNRILLYNRFVSITAFGFSKNTDNELGMIPPTHPSDTKRLWHVDTFFHFILINFSSLTRESFKLICDREILK